MNKGASFLWVVLGVVLAMAGVLLTTRFLSGYEDTWVCKDGSWVKHGNPARPMPSESCEMVDKNGKFEKTGNITKYDGDNFWTLVYEEPGAPALKKQLNFNSKSQCKLGITQVACDDLDMENGTGVYVLGIPEDESVSVLKLETR